MNARDALLQAVRDGLQGGFCLEWRPAGISRAWPGQALLAWATQLRRRWHRSLPPRARIAVALPNSPAYIAHWLAAWQGDWVFCPLPESSPAERTRRLQSLRPALFVDWQDRTLREQWLPVDDTISDPTDLASIYWSSASIGQGSAYGLSYAALLWQWRQHAPQMELDRQSLLRNTLPWAHVFAGVLELLPALIAGAELRVAPILELRHEAFTHLLTVPRVAALLDDEQIRSLRRGNVGGAAMDDALAQRLRGSALQVGYGQTEAGPGISLGARGEFSTGCIGSFLPEVECQLDETLRYRSPGQALERWDGHAWRSIVDAEGYVDSGDRIAPLVDGGYRWLGRRDSAFKLADGRGIQPEGEELRLRARYPSLQQIVVGAPGERRLAVLAAVADAELAQLRRRWQEPYPLYVMPPDSWSSWQSAAGKPRRLALYHDWPGILSQALRVGGK